MAGDRRRRGRGATLGMSVDPDQLDASLELVLGGEDKPGASSMSIGAVNCDHGHFQDDDGLLFTVLVWRAGWAVLRSWWAVPPNDVTLNGYSRLHTTLAMAGRTEPELEPGASLEELEALALQKGCCPRCLAECLPTFHRACQAHLFEVLNVH